MENTGKLFFDQDTPQWFVAMGSKSEGPFSAADVMRKIEQGEITWAHYAWRAGLAAWKRICDIEAFQAAVPMPPPQDMIEDLKPGTKGAKPSVRKAAPRAPEPKEWFLHMNDTQYGPVHREEIERLLHLGRVPAGALAWKDGMKDWSALSQIPEFKGLAPASTAKKSSEKRRATRQPLVAKVLISDDDSVALGVCRDISIGGMQVLTDRIPGKVGSKIRLNVSPTQPSKLSPFVATGVIVRILEDGRGFSFRFDLLNDAARKALEKIAEQL
jgi:hypothetical protein